MKKYTPGPWSLPHFARDDHGCRCGYVFGGEGEYTVAEVFRHDDKDRYFQHAPIEEAKANARLIAAAPDMADALAALVPLATAFMGSYGATHGFPDGHPEHKAAIDSARAALVKAGVEL